LRTRVAFVRPKSQRGDGPTSGQLGTVPGPFSRLAPDVGPFADNVQTRLAMPEHWVIADVAIARMRTQLARAAPAVSGVIAPLGAVPPGSSCRVAAERAALLPPSTLAPSYTDHVRGAVLLRRGVDYVLLDGQVALPPVQLLTDRGAVVHDPWAPVEPLEPASSIGRPPWPWRPIVLFLGTVIDPPLADWVRQIANGLLRRGDTEARVALPAPTCGLYLTRPCVPDETAVSALRPDAVVALDRDAREAAHKWLNGDRSAVVVELTPADLVEPELVSWRIDAAQGRVRARIGRRIGADRLAELVRRLCGGPQPLPPRAGVDATVPVRTIGNRSLARSVPCRSQRFVALVADAADQQRFRAFTDHMEEHQGHIAICVVSDGVPPEAEAADILFVRGLSGSASIQDAVAGRRAARLPTVVDLAATEVEMARDRPVIPAEADEFVRLAGAVTAVSRQVCDLFRSRGVRALVVPSLLTRSQRNELVQARSRRSIPPPPIIGWHTGSGSAEGNGDHAAVLDVVCSLLDERPEMRLEIVGDATDVANRLTRHDRVRISPGSPTIKTVARWRAQFCTPSSHANLTGHLTPVARAHYLRVPTLVAAKNPAVAERLVPSALTVRKPDDWRSVTVLLDDLAWSDLARQAMQLAEALYGHNASQATVNRLLGWIRFGGGK
jgi:hypothetical protein